jgi:hypothetical protein
MLWVRLPPEPLTTLRPRGAARSARRFVTPETVGSNPIEDAFRGGRLEAVGLRKRLRVNLISSLRSTACSLFQARYAIWQSGEAQTFVILWVRLPPVPLKRLSHEHQASAGHWRAQVAVTHPPAGCGGSIPSRRTENNKARSSSGSGRQPLTLEGRVRLPHGLLKKARWWNRQTRSPQNAVPLAAWEFKSPPGHFSCRRAGAQLAFIWPVRPVRYRGLQLDRLKAGDVRWQLGTNRSFRLQPTAFRLLRDRVRKSAKRRGREPRACGFDSRSGH